MLSKDLEKKISSIYWLISSASPNQQFMIIMNILLSLCSPSYSLLQDVLQEQNVSAGVIISRDSLVVQRVQRVRAGQYRCRATNTLAATTSNPVTLKIRCEFLLFTVTLSCIGRKLQIFIVRVDGNCGAGEYELWNPWQDRLDNFKTSIHSAKVYLMYIMKKSPSHYLLYIFSRQFLSTVRFFSGHFWIIFHTFPRISYNFPRISV